MINNKFLEVDNIFPNKNYLSLKFNFKLLHEVLEKSYNRLKIVYNILVFHEFDMIDVSFEDFINRTFIHNEFNACIFCLDF